MRERGQFDSDADGSARWVLGLAVAGCLIVWAVIGLWLSGAAQAAPLEVGAYSESATAPMESEVEPSATDSTVNVLCVEGHEGSTVKVLVDGHRVGFIELGSAAAHDSQACMTLMLAPKQKYEVVNFGGPTPAVTRSVATIAAPAGGGEPGPEGKEGKEGKEGPEGKEGAEGKEGKAGGGGGGEGGEGGGEVQVASFGAPAEQTLAEGVEAIEILTFCLIGTVLAGCLFMTVRRMVAP